MAASLTYYTTVALAPLVVVFLAVLGLAFGSATAREQLIATVQLDIGDTGAMVVRALIERIASPRLGILATILGGIALFFGATGVFIDLKSSLKAIWNVPEEGTGGVGSFLLARLVSFAMVVVTGAMIVFSISISISLSAIHHYFSNWGAAKGSQLADIVLSFAFTTALFAIVYRVVPPERMPWRHIIFGAAVTAILFTAGRAAISTYIGTVGIGSPYGTAGSLFAFLIWLYYSSQVFFIGAIITRSRARAERIGEGVKREAELTQMDSSFEHVGAD